MGRMQELMAPKKSYSRAFALPTILIASTVMLIVLLSAVQATVSTNNAINNQYLDKIGKEAAESGVAMAKACMAANGSITWSNATPLKPNTNCSGADQAGGACTNTSVDTRCYILNSTNYRSSFTVGVIMSGSTPTDFDAKGIVSNVRTKSLGVASQSTYSSKQALTQSVLVNVGATNSFASFPTWGSAYYSAPVCGITSTGELWCANAVDSASLGSSLQATFQYDFSYNGGPATCYDSTKVTVISCATTSGSAIKYSLTNLSDSTNGLFKGKVLSSVHIYGGFGSGSTYRRSVLCVTTTDGQVLCADTTNSGSVNNSFGATEIPFSGGVTTCYDSTRVTVISCATTSGSVIKYYVANLSDSTNGLFKGKVIYSNPANNAYTYTTTYLY